MKESKQKVVGLILAILAGIALYYIVGKTNKNQKEKYLQYQRQMEEHYLNNNNVCTGDCSKNKKLLPILEPAFNLRECALQLILLEDHLNYPEKRCQQCIRKHLLTIEGLSGEAYGLDKDKQYVEDCEKVLNLARECGRRLTNGDDPSSVAQTIRPIRKEVMNKYYDVIFTKEHTEEQIPLAKN